MTKLKGSLAGAILLLGGVVVAHAEDTMICGFVLNKTDQNVLYSLAIEPGGARAVELAFQKDNQEIRHPNGGAPYWFISTSPNGGRNYIYAPDRRYIISVAPGSPALIPVGTGQMKAWSAGLFVNGKRVSRDEGFCAAPTSIPLPSMPPVEQAPTMPETREEIATAPEPQPNPPPAPADDLGAAFDAYQ